MGIIYDGVNIYKDGSLKYELKKCAVSFVSIEGQYKLAYVDGYENGVKSKITIANFDVKSMTSQLLAFNGVMYDDVEVTIDVSVACVMPRIEAMYFKLCERCESSFVSRRSDARFCGEKCRNAASKKRTREKKIK